VNKNAAYAPGAAHSQSHDFPDHAKQDGTTPAQRIRDYIYSQTQLAAFYDENDIAYGRQVRREDQCEPDSPDTAAMVVCGLERYAFRPWCRREVVPVRKPAQEKRQPGAPNGWAAFPDDRGRRDGRGQATLGIPRLEQPDHPLE